MLHFESGYDSTRHDRCGRWLWRLVRRGWNPDCEHIDGGEQQGAAEIMLRSVGGTLVAVFLRRLGRTLRTEASSRR